MTPSRWEQVFALFDAALAMPGVDRNAFLARDCRDDARKREDVESLLAAHHDATGFLSRGPGPPETGSVRAHLSAAGPLRARGSDGCRLSAGRRHAADVGAGRRGQATPVPAVRDVTQLAVVGSSLYFSPCGSHRYRNLRSGAIETWPIG